MSYFEVLTITLSIFAVIVSLVSIWMSGRSADAAEESAKASLESAKAAREGNLIALKSHNLEYEAVQRGIAEKVFEARIEELRGKVERPVREHAGLETLGKTLVGEGYKCEEIREAIRRYWQNLSDKQPSRAKPLPVSDYVNRDLIALSNGLNAIERDFAGFTKKE